MYAKTNATTNASTTTPEGPVTTKGSWGGNILLSKIKEDQQRFNYERERQEQLEIEKILRHEQEMMNEAVKRSMADQMPKPSWGNKNLASTIKEKEAQLQRLEEEQVEMALKKSIEDEKKRPKPFQECDPTEFPPL